MSSTPRSLALAALASLAFLVTPLAGARSTLAAPLAQEQKGGFHVDERYGYKVRFPRDWQIIPIKTDESWLVASYVSDKTYFYTDDVEGWTWEHKPEMQVIAFVDQEEMAKVTKEEDRITIEWKNPYKDYKEYLRGTYTGGGFYVSAEETDEIGGVKVTKLEIKVEKYTHTGPKRIVTWVFEAPGVDFAVHFETLEDEYSKLRKLVERSLKSFELIPRTKGGLPARQTGPGGGIVVIDKSAEKEKSPEERRRERIEENRALHAKALDNVTPGWTAKKMGPFLVISHVDDRYAKRLVDQLESLMKWLDETLDFWGPGEYVREPILRICADQAEESSFRKGNWWSFDGEIVTHKDLSDGHNSFEQKWVKRRVLQIWLQDRDAELYLALPKWIDMGLDQVIEGIRFKGRRVEFTPDDWERDRLRQAVREGKVHSARDLLLLDTAALESSMTSGSYFELSYQTASLVRFLIDGARRREYKELFPDYLRNLKAVVEEYEARDAGPDDEPEAEPQTEEEEEARFREKRNAWRQKEKELLEAVFERTFGGWGEQDWEKFERAYEKYLG